MEQRTGRLPHTTVEWLVWAWGIGGVMLLLSQAILRLGGRALGVFGAPLTAIEGLVLVAWTGFMLYTEAWRGFHHAFSPRVVARAGGLLDRPARLWWLAPVVAMGLLHATPRRRWVSRILLVAIVGMVLVVRTFPEPWRGIVDFGVVTGLAAGVVSIVWYAARALQGESLPVPMEFPEEAS